MKSPWTESALVRRKGATLSLTATGLGELIQAVLEKGVPFRFRATGLSMVPFVRNGDLVTLHPLSGAAPRLGEVVAFNHPDTGKLILHRVVGKNGGRYLLRGDNLLFADGYIKVSCILGRVTQVQRAGKRVWLSFGPEKIVVAWLNRTGLIRRLVLPAYRWCRPLAGKGVV